VEGFLRKEGNHVEGELARSAGEDHETRGGVGGGGSKDGGDFFPIGRGCGQVRFGQDGAGLGFEAHDERRSGAGELAGEEGDVVTVSGFHCDAAETLVLQAYAGTGFLNGEGGVAGIVFVERSGGFDGDRALGAVALHELPGGEGGPAVVIGGGVVEGTILDQLGVESAVRGVAEILKEDAHEVRADGLFGRGGDGDRGFLGVRDQPEGKRDTKERDGFGKHHEAGEEGGY